MRKSSNVSPTQVRLQSPNEAVKATTACPDPYKRLVADKPGEELAPDAGIWQLYVEEASEHDAELVKERNGTLDVMLLFAALFSAILTAFLIDSKSLLQENSADLSATLLLAIAQSQQRMEQGSPQVIPLLERPSFSAPAYARWINGLWFTALSLSLAAALIAMLAKEWLTAFIASRSRSPHIYAHLHQIRLEGMRKWRVLHIIDLLPSMLHLSLLLFSLGLAVHLWTLDTGIALVELVVVVLAFIFYLGTSVAGAFDESSPFVTQVSKYLRAVCQKRQFVNTKTADTTKQATFGDLQALLWLVENARNPATSDCACQALAGLQVSTKQPPVSNRNGEPKAEARTNSHSHEIKPNNVDRIWGTVSQSQVLAYPSALISSRGSLMRQLFDQTCVRLHRVNTRQQRGLEASQGMNVARYSAALPALVQYLELYSGYGLTKSKTTEQEPEKESHNPTQCALNAIDTVWSNDCPEFSSDAYALLAAAEIRLTHVVASIHYPDQDMSPKQPPIHISISDHNKDLSDWTIIDIGSDENILPDGIASLSELRGRYSRSLARASIMLCLHNNGRTTVNPYPLVCLLDSIREAARCANLNPASGVSTCLPQPEDTNTLPKFNIALVGTGTVRSVPPNDLGDEDSLLPGIIRLLSSPGIEKNTDIETSAVRTLAIFGPVLIRQWFDEMDRHKVEISNKDVLNKVLVIWPQINDRVHLSGLVNLTLAQLMCMVVVGLSQIDCEYMQGLAGVAVSTFFSRATMESGKSTLCFLGDDHPELLETFVQIAAWSSTKMPPEARSQCLKLLLVEQYNGTLIRRQGMSPPCLPSLLRLIANTPGHPSEVQSIFAELKTLLPCYHNGDVSYVLGFMRQSEGFIALVDIAALPEYTIAAVDFILRIIEVAAKNTVTYSWHQHAYLARDAIVGFLGAVMLVIRTEVSGQNHSTQLSLFMRGVITIMNRLDEQALEFTANHPDMALVNVELAHVWESNIELAKVRDEWEDSEIQTWVPANSWHLRGLRELFSSP